MLHEMYSPKWYKVQTYEQNHKTLTAKSLILNKIVKISPEKFTAIGTLMYIETIHCTTYKEWKFANNLRWLCVQEVDSLGAYTHTCASMHV